MQRYKLFSFPPNIFHYFFIRVALAYALLKAKTEGRSLIPCFTRAQAYEFFLIFAITAITKRVNDWLTESCCAKFSDSKVIAVIAKRVLAEKMPQNIQILA